MKNIFNAKRITSVKQYSIVLLICLSFVFLGQVPGSYAQTKTESATKAEQTKAESNSDEKTEADEQAEKPRKPRYRSDRSVTRADTSLLSVFKPVAISASESCKLADGEVLAAKVVGIDTENDLALLKVAADGLAVAPLAEEESPLRGSWLITPIDEKGKIAIGVVAVNQREIPRGGAFIGINMEDVDEGVRIVNILPGLPAAKARLRVGDIILKLDDDVIEDINALRESIGKYSPENRITLKVLRDKEEMEFTLTLEDRNKVDQMGARSRIQNRMGSELSKRAKDFPMAFQHDTALQANECGGPVVDIEGRIVGINIAREGRVSSLAIPTSMVLEVVDRLKTGEFGPVTVYADRIKHAESDLKKLSRSLTEGTKNLVRKEYTEQIKKIYELQAFELEKLKTKTSERINSLYKERQGLSKSKRDLKAKNKDAEKEINKLKRKIEALKAGRSY